MEGRVLHERWRLFLQIQRRATVSISILAVLLFVFTSLKRIQYPFELDRMESAMMTTVWRVVHGEPVYVRPSLDWTPFLYSPLFFYVAAAMTHVTGVGYQALRAVSILSTLGSFVVIGRMVYRETGNFTAAAASIGLFAMLYSLVLSWYDIGRVDSLSVFLFLLATYCMRFKSPLLAAFVWMLAFQTKQSFLPLAILTFLAEWQQPRRLLLGLGSFLLMAAGSVALFNHVSQGWYSYYVFGTISKLGLSSYLAKLFLPFDLFQPLGIAISVCVFAALLSPLSWRSRRTSFYGILSFLILGGIWFARAHEGSYRNTLIPAYAWICVLFGLALDRLSTKWKLEGASSEDSVLSLAWTTMVWLIPFLQIALHLYRPGAFAIPAETAKARWDFVNRIRNTPGDVWIVNHSYDGILAGKGMHAEMDAFDAVLGREDPQSIQQIQRAYQGHEFTAVILDRDPSTYKPSRLFQGMAFRQAYPLHAMAPGAGMPEAGDQPVLMYLPCHPEEGATAALAMQSTFVQQAGCR